MFIEERIQYEEVNQVMDVWRRLLLASWSWVLRWWCVDPRVIGLAHWRRHCAYAHTDSEKEVFRQWHFYPENDRSWPRVSRLQSQIQYCLSRLSEGAVWVVLFEGVSWMGVSHVVQNEELKQRAFEFWLFEKGLIVSCSPYTAVYHRVNTNKWYISLSFYICLALPFLRKCTVLLSQFSYQLINDLICHMYKLTNWYLKLLQPNNFVWKIDTWRCEW